MTSDLEREIAETREHLGETVDALAAKLDVKARAQEAVAATDKRPFAAGRGPRRRGARGPAVASGSLTTVSCRG